MIVSSSGLSPHAMAATGLEQVCLRKIAQWLAWVLTRASTNLVMNLIVEVFREGGIRSMLIGVASCGNKLLQLDTSDKVFILGGHEAIILG